MDTNCAHFRFMQSERLNIITLTGDTYLSNNMSGSTIIADIRSNSFSLYLPKPESGLNFRIIIKAANSTLGKQKTLRIYGTSDDSTSADVITFVGLTTENLDSTTDLPPKTNSDLKSLNILQGNNITSLFLGSPYIFKNSSSTTVTNTNTDETTNNLFNSTGDFIELICDGTDWFSHGITKNRSVYKIIGSNIISTN